jgi:hypothetical protein
MTERSAFQWIIAFPDEKTTAVGRPCLRAACRGNERIGLVLNYFIFEASLEAQRRKLGCHNESCVKVFNKQVSREARHMQEVHMI